MDEVTNNKEPLINFLQKIIHVAVRILAVLIAIEIFVNNIIYLRDDVIHVKIVLATALMATAVAYWLVVYFTEQRQLADQKEKEG